MKEHIFLMLRVVEGVPFETKSSAFTTEARMPRSTDLLVTCCHINRMGMCDGGMDAPLILIQNWGCLTTRRISEEKAVEMYAKALAKKSKKMVLGIVPITQAWYKLPDGEMVRVFSCAMQ
jgi:hypothetical protein